MTTHVRWYMCLLVPSDDLTVSIVYELYHEFTCLIIHGHNYSPVPTLVHTKLSKHVPINLYTVPTLSHTKLSTTRHTCKHVTNKSIHFVYHYKLSKDKATTVGLYLMIYQV